MSIKLDRRALICDDTPSQYDMIKKALAKEFVCVPRVSTLEAMRQALREASASREWFSLVLIDMDLSKGDSGETWNGVQLYLRLRDEFPDENYIVYTRHDADRFRTEINRLAYHRDVELVLLDEILTQRKVSLALARAITTVPPDRVFLVYGRNDDKNTKLVKLLGTGLGLTVVSFEAARESVTQTRDYIFEIVLAGIQRSHATVVLFTDDEDCTLRAKFRSKADEKVVRRARPNVYIEAGYALGLRPKRTIFVEWPDKLAGFEGPSDFQGIHTLRYQDTPDDRSKLQQRLEGARCSIQPAPNFLEPTFFDS